MNDSISNPAALKTCALTPALTEPYEESQVPDRPVARAFLKTRLSIDEDKFVFLAAFDSFSFIQRKNHRAVVEAFQDAFPADSRVRLLMKTHNKNYVTDPAQAKIWHALNEAISAEPRIIPLNETLSYYDLIRMKAGCDCYVFLNRSGGWSFGKIEAINIDIPVIATEFSGNMEFCNEDTCWLVDYALQALDRDDYIFVAPGQRWAEPSHDSGRVHRPNGGRGAENFSALLDDPALARRVGEAGAGGCAGFFRQGNGAAALARFFRGDGVRAA